LDSGKPEGTISDPVNPQKRLIVRSIMDISVVTGPDSDEEPDATRDLGQEINNWLKKLTGLFNKRY
jgi:hypothetical protein